MFFSCARCAFAFSGHRITFISTPKITSTHP